MLAVHEAPFSARPAAILLIPALGIAAAALGDGPHWTYQGHGGPSEWGSLDPAFVACKVGKLQSPIDIQGAQTANLAAIKFDYKPVPDKIIDNGHTIQVNYAPGSSIDVGGSRYELVQFHFHRPKEEKINGNSFAMVAHLVHANAAGQLAVVAVLNGRWQSCLRRKPKNRL
jgi:carbonic anhydrase